MSNYPLSSLPENLSCMHYTGRICPTYPCTHVPSHDPDYLADREDSLQDKQFHRLFWNLYRIKCNPSLRMKSPIPYVDPEILKLKYERCQRMEEKKDQINRDKINHLRRRVQWNRESWARYLEENLEQEVDDLKNWGMQDSEALVEEEQDDLREDLKEYVPVHLHREEDLILPYGMTKAERLDIFGDWY